MSNPSIVKSFKINNNTIVVGNVSATNLFYDVSGNSQQWGSVFSWVKQLSSNWNSAYSSQTGYLPLTGGTITGNLTVNGSFAAQTKSFLISHPSYASRKLQYGSLESPYHGIRLTGRGVITSKITEVNLPHYIKNLVQKDEVNIQLTNINHSKILFVKSIDIDNNKFIIGVEKKWTEILCAYEFFWSFTAIRKDVSNLQVEV